MAMLKAQRRKRPCQKHKGGKVRVCCSLLVITGGMAYTPHARRVQVRRSFTSKKRPAACVSDPGPTQHAIQQHPPAYNFRHHFI